MVARTRAGAIASLVLVALLVSAAPLAADDLSSNEFADLVGRISEGDAPFSDLEVVSSVDGLSIDLESIQSSGWTDASAQIETLRALLDDTSNLDSPELRDQANEILSNAPYEVGIATGPSLLERAWNAIASVIGGDALGVLGYVILIGAVLFLVVPLLLRRTRPNNAASESTTEPAERRDYEVEALAASQAGDYETAVRLLFLDGADHLEKADAVASAATTSTATVKRLTRNGRFLDRFDEIAYGGSVAAEEDVAESKSSWQRIKQRFS